MVRFTAAGYYLLCSVCVTGGYVTSYWNRPFFPEGCTDGDFDDTATYDTMVRIAGSLSGVALAFKAVADMYGWTHIEVAVGAAFRKERAIPVGRNVAAGYAH